MSEQPVLGAPEEREIRDELQRLVLADLNGPFGGDDEEFSGENPIDRYPLGRLAPRGEVLQPDDQDELAAADTGEASEADPEPSAPNVPSLTRPRWASPSTLTGRPPNCGSRHVGTLQVHCFRAGGNARQADVAAPAAGRNGPVAARRRTACPASPRSRATGRRGARPLPSA
ncbi:MAG TPA: hypothetical protein VFQ77_20135 [Pseudonocardiaceae bacterium]|nr:hypothetical protein [Pseudonocardiaceae bacterium]